MKPILGKSAVALAVIFQFFSVSASAQQLLASPGFELGGFPVAACPGGGTTTPVVTGQMGNHWVENSCWMSNTGTLTYALDAVNPHTGSVSQSVTSSAGAGQFWAYVPLNSGKKYTSSIWLKASQPTEVSLQLRRLGPPYTAYGSRVAKVTTTWQQFSFDGYSPVSSTQLDGSLFVMLNKPGTIWVDDASVTAVADTTVDTLRSDVAVPKNYFGMHVHRDPSWPTVGSTIGSERLWDSQGTQWADVYPVDPAAGGVANWTDFDARVNRAIANGAEPIVVLGGNIPRWASADPNGTQAGSSFYGLGSSAPPSSEAAWTTWVTAVAQRYNGKVKHWEIWNEPYQNAMFRANIPGLVRLAQLAYPILKNTNAANKVLSPSFDAYSTDFMERYLQAGGGAYTDIVSIHAYDFYHGNLLDGTVPAASKSGDPAAPEAMYYKEHLPRNVKLILARNGLGSLPVWNTEGGYGAQTASGTPNDAAGAPYLARNMILGWALGGIDRNFYYAWDQRENWVAGGREAVVGNNVYVKTAAGSAYEQVAKWLTGAKMLSKSIDANGTWTIELDRGIFAARQYVIWNPAGSFPATVPSGINYVNWVTNLSGTKTSIPGSFYATPSPVLLTRN
ncbi:MAG: hypothetical protein EOP38_16675 [Rubrivivax sp.]|nr:MAG: hypothetical protein EOP38_16675 [Rubrivivax sp.]